LGGLVKSHEQGRLQAAVAPLTGGLDRLPVHLCRERRIQRRQWRVPALLAGDQVEGAAFTQKRRDVQPVAFGGQHARR
jgi:hypothetical protein